MAARQSHVARPGIAQSGRAPNEQDLEVGTRLAQHGGDRGLTLSVADVCRAKSADGPPDVPNVEAIGHPDVMLSGSAPSKHGAPRSRVTWERAPGAARQNPRGVFLAAWPLDRFAGSSVSLSAAMHAPLWLRVLAPTLLGLA